MIIQYSFINNIYFIIDNGKVIERAKTKAEAIKKIKYNIMTNKQAKKRLEEIRAEIKAEKISYGEIAELQELKKYIKPGDVELLEWAGVEEK